MAAAKRKGAAGAAPSRARVAAAEADEPQPKTVEFRGLTLTLGEALPNTFIWDAAEANGNELAYYQLVQSLVPPEQRLVVRSVLAESGEDSDAFMSDLADVVLGAYGIGLGESSASQES
jgi:hypothetical protein